MNYQEVDNLLSGRTRQHRKYANNTYFIRHDDYLALVYHSTEVVKFYQNGDIVLDNGGWYTSTTKERINWMLPQGFYLSQNSGVWYITNGNSYRFSPGIVIKANGDIKGYIPDTPKADKKLKTKVKAYSQLCADNIPLDKPGGGDCWYCLMTAQDGNSLGDATNNTDHLDSHMEENYIVPSLVYRALIAAGNTDFILSLVFNNPDNAMLDIAKQRVKSAVYKYILRCKGFAL